MPDNLLCNLAIIYGAGLAVIAIIDLVRRLVGAPLPGPSNFLARVIVVLLAPLVIGLGLEHGLRAVNGEAYNASDALEPKKIKACVHRVIKKKYLTEDPGSNAKVKYIGADASPLTIHNVTDVEKLGFSGLARLNDNSFVGVKDEKNFIAEAPFTILGQQDKCKEKADDLFAKYIRDGEDATPQEKKQNAALRKFRAEHFCSGTGWLSLIRQKTPDGKGSLQQTPLKLKIKSSLDQNTLLPSDLESTCRLSTNSGKSVILAAESAFGQRTREKLFGRIFRIEIDEVAKTATVTGIARLPESFSGFLEDKKELQVIKQIAKRKWQLVAKDIYRYDILGYSATEIEGIICTQMPATAAEPKAKISLIGAMRGSAAQDSKIKDNYAQTGNLVRFADFSFSDNKPVELSVAWRSPVVGPHPGCKRAEGKGEQRSISELHYDEANKSLYAVSSFAIEDKNSPKFCSSIYKICDDVDDKSRTCRSFDPFALRSHKPLVAWEQQIVSSRKRFEGLTSAPAPHGFTVATEQEGDGEIGYLSNPPATP